MASDVSLLYTAVGRRGRAGEGGDVTSAINLSQTTVLKEHRIYKQTSGERPRQGAEKYHGVEMTVNTSEPKRGGGRTVHHTPSRWTDHLAIIQAG